VSKAINAARVSFPDTHIPPPTAVYDSITVVVVGLGKSTVVITVRAATEQVYVTIAICISDRVNAIAVLVDAVPAHFAVTRKVRSIGVVAVLSGGYSITISVADNDR
jgi:hypothetical protein